MVWNLFPFKSGFCFGKNQKLQVPHLSCRGAESPWWFHISPKKSAGDMMFEQVLYHDEATNHQLPIALTCWIIWIVSMEECSSLTQNLTHIHWSTCSVISSMMATWHTCSPNSVYHPHWPVHWSHHLSCMHVAVHSLWLPVYIDVAHTVLIILTMAGLFQDRPCILIFYQGSFHVGFIGKVMWTELWVRPKLS